MANVKKERFPFGRGWSLAKFHATMTEPRVMPIIGLPKAWTRGTNGTFTADVVRAEITNEADAAQVQRPAARQDRADAAGARSPHARQGPIVLRYGDDPKWMEEVLSMPRAGARAGRGRGWRPAARRGPRPGQRLQRERSSTKTRACSRCSTAAPTATCRAGGSDLTWQTQRVDGGTVFVSVRRSRGRCARRQSAAGDARRRALQPDGAAARAQRAGEGRAQHRGEVPRRDAAGRLQRRRRDSGHRQGRRDRPHRRALRFVARRARAPPTTRPDRPR